MGKKTYVCIHNWGVDCKGTSRCEKCGWNPVVEQTRKEKIRAEFRKEAGE